MIAPSAHTTTGLFAVVYPVPPAVTVTEATLPAVTLHVAAAPAPVHGGSQIMMAVPARYEVPVPGIHTVEAFISTYIHSNVRIHVSTQKLYHSLRRSRLRRW